MLRFVVNLDRSIERFRCISESLESFGLSFTRISAIDGKLLTKNELQKLAVPKDERLLCFRELTPGEVGCFLSHRECWKKLVESDQNWALILEDDCVFSTNAKSLMETENWIPKDIQLCQLAHIGCSGEKVIIERRKYKLFNGSEVVRVIKPHHIGTLAYLIHRDVARVALDATRKIEAPVDEFLFSMRYSFGREYAGWMVNPYPVKPDVAVGSTIGHEKENSDFGRPGSLAQFCRKVFNRVYVSIYRKVRGKRSIVRFE